MTLAFAVLLTTLVLALQYRTVYLRGKALRALEASLVEFHEFHEAHNALNCLTPFAATCRMIPVAQGWNTLLLAINELKNAQHTTALDDDAGHLLCTYDAQRLLGLLHSLPDGVVLTDPVGAIVLANRACEGLIGCPLNDILGRSVLQLFDDPAATRHLQNILQQAAADDFFEIALAPPHDTLNAQPSQATTLRVYCQRLNTERDDTAVLLTIRDVTQQKMRESGQEHFIDHVSHEFRSPLTNIRAYAETLLSDMVLDAQTQKDAFNVINDETNRLIRLVNDVLDLSRMETGALSLEKGEVVLDRLIPQCVNDVKATATAKKYHSAK